MQSRNVHLTCGEKEQSVKYRTSVLFRRQLQTRILGSCRWYIAFCRMNTWLRAQTIKVNTHILTILEEATQHTPTHIHTHACTHIHIIYMFKTNLVLINQTEGSMIPACPRPNSEHQLNTTSFGGRCRKAMLGVGLMLLFFVTVCLFVCCCCCCNNGNVEGSPKGLIQLTFVFVCLSLYIAVHTFMFRTIL